MIDEARLEREAAANPEPQALIEILLDDSASMQAEGRIDALNAALPILRNEFSTDALAAKRAKIALRSLQRGLILDFVKPAAFEAPVLEAGGMTPLGASVGEAYAHIIGHQRSLMEQGVRVYRPALYIISDGEPNDEYEKIAATVAGADRAGKINVFAIGVADADLKVLAKFTHNFPPLPLHGLKFTQLMKWITVVAKQVTRSTSHSGGNAAARVQLPSVKDWANLHGA
jgi:uncharacterized protein YegL